ncbi:MAG: tetratricopeptide repeat protein [Gammaproteobacteria bacterium]
MMQRLRHLTALLGLILALAGCATNPGRNTEDAGYSELYNGEMKVAHAAGQQETTRDEAVARGDQALADGDMDRAMYEYVHALEISDGDAETLNKIGAIHTRLGNLRLAARAYTLSLKLEPENAAALEGVGLLLLRERRYEDARRHLAAALEKDPHRWQSHNGLGMLADLEGEHAQAAEHYSRALEIPPGSEQLPDTALLLNNLGYSLYLNGDWQGAQQHFRRALDYRPDFTRAWQNLGLVHTRKGEYDLAMEAFRHVMDKPEAYNNIGFVCMINRQYEQAEYFFRQAIQLSPTYYVKAHENLERLNRLRGRDG